MPKNPNEKEETCEHDYHLILNEQKIIKVTITDHYQKKPGRKDITHETILSLLKKLNGRTIESEPKKKPHWPEVFVRNRILYQNKKYRLVFWFKDGTTNHLWVKTCHRQD